MLVRSLRNQYNNLDEIADPSGEQTRTKSNSTEKTGKKKSKSRKVHIAPTNEAENETKAGSTDGEVEMVDLGSVENGGDTHRLITDSTSSGTAKTYLNTKQSATSDADPTNNAGMETSPATEDDIVDDTQSLLRPTSSAGRSKDGAIDITGMVTAAPKRVIIADMLRFLFLGIPG